MGKQVYRRSAPKHEVIWRQFANQLRNALIQQNFDADALSRRPLDNRIQAHKLEKHELVGKCKILI